MPTPIRVTPAFKKRLKKKPQDQRDRVIAAVGQLRDNPRHPGLRTSKVRGTRDVWEARIDGGNRLTFHWDGDTIVLRNHCHHDIVGSASH